MVNGHLRHHEQHKASSRQPPSLLRPLKDIRCRECRTRRPPASSSTHARDSCPHRREFAPTGKSTYRSLTPNFNTNLGNRFSILAELEQQPSQSKWAFDSAQSTGTGVRRRGKRGGKHSRLKYERPRRQDQKSESEGIETLCKEQEVLRSNGEDTIPDGELPSNSISNTVPQCGFNFSTDTGRHQWIPQIRSKPQSLHLELPRTMSEPKLEPVMATKAELPQPLKRCLRKKRAVQKPLVELAHLKSKESSFFPMTAFLTTPDRAAGHPDTPTLPASPTKIDTPKKQLAFVAPTSTLKEAAEATRRALTIRQPASPPLATSIGPYNSRLVSPSRLANSTPESPPRSSIPTTAVSSSMISPFAPLPFTPSSTASPALTTSPVLSTVQFQATSPSIVSIPGPLSFGPQRSPPMPHGPVLAPSKPLVVKDRTHSNELEEPSSTSTSPLSLIALPTVVSYPQVSKSPQYITNSSLTPPDIISPNPSSKPIFPLVPLVKRPTRVPQEPVSSATQEELSNFLGMGHANPCWCNAHKSNHLKLLPSIPAQPATPPTPMHELSESPIEEVRHQIEIRRKRNFSDSDLDSIPLVLSPVDSDFEDLCLRPSEVDSDESEEWTVVTPSERYRKPMTKLQIASDDEKMATLISFLSPTISVDSSWSADSTKSMSDIGNTTDVITNHLDQSVSHPQNVEVNAELRTPNSISSYNPWTLTTSAITVDFTIPNNLHTATTTGTTIHAPSSPQLSSYLSEDLGECKECNTCTCVCTEAVNTSAIEWPTLQDATKIKRTKREVRSGTDVSVKSDCKINGKV